MEDRIRETGALEPEVWVQNLAALLIFCLQASFLAPCDSVSSSLKNGFVWIKLNHTCKVHNTVAGT